MKKFTFEAALQRSTGWGAYVIFPHDVQREFATKGRVPVQALFEGISYEGSLMPSGTGYHFLGVLQGIRKQLGKDFGDSIRVELWKDDAPRTVDMPKEFLTLLRKEKLLKRFRQLSRTRQKEYRNWLTTAKREETRLRRLAKSIELLKAEAGSEARTR